MTFDPHVQTVTQDYIVPKVYDQTLDSNAVTMIFLANGEPWAGESYKFPVKLSNHTQGGAFSDFADFSTSGENVRQMASFDPRGHYFSVVLGGIARSVNGVSKTQLLNLVKVEMESVSQDMADSVGDTLQGDGTGSSNAAFLGVLAGIDDGTTVATYGSLSRSTYTAWKSTLSTSIGAWDFAKARLLWNKATVGNRKPNFAYCDETTFSYIEADYTASVEGNYNLVQSNRATMTRNGIAPQMQAGFVGQAGFDMLYYAGTGIVRDDKGPSQQLVVMNTEFNKWLGLTPADCNLVSFNNLYHEGNDVGKMPTNYGFGWTGFVRPHDKYAFIGQMILLGNFINKAPRLSTRGTGISS